MSKQKTKIQIQICSNCKSHQWCTRHNEATYSALAMEIQKALKSHDDSIDVEIFQVGGHKMGSFQITCNGTLLFSKLHLGYFPHVTSATARILSFIDDSKNGRDLKKYSQTNVSPHKSPNNSGGSFSGGSPKKESKKIKYVPDYRDPSQQQTQSFVLNQKKPEVKAHGNQQQKKRQQKHEQKKEEGKKENKVKQEHEHHQQKKGDENNDHDEKKQAVKKQENKKTEQHKIQHEKHEPKHDKNQQNQGKKPQQKKTDQHKGQVSKQGHKKTEEHKQAVKKEEPTHKQSEVKPKEQQFVMNQDKGDKLVPPKVEDKKIEQKKDEHKKSQQKLASEKAMQQVTEKKDEAVVQGKVQAKAEQSKGEEVKPKQTKAEQKQKGKEDEYVQVQDNEGYEQDFEGEGKGSSIIKSPGQ